MINVYRLEAFTFRGYCLLQQIIIHISLNLQSIDLVQDSLAFIGPACRSGWEEMDNLRGNLGKIEEILEEIIQNEVSIGGSPTIKVILVQEPFKNFQGEVLKSKCNFTHTSSPIWS